MSTDLHPSQPGPELLARGRQALLSQPFSQLLGTTLEALQAGQAELHLPLRRDLLQQHGFVHGGALSYLADNALTFAGGSLLGDCVTAEYKINYLRPAVGEEGRLVAVAQAVASGRTQAVCRCDVYLQREPQSQGAAPERVLCAAAQGTIRKVA